MASEPAPVRDLSISFARANLYTLVLALPLIVLSVEGFARLWGWSAFGLGLVRFSMPWIFLPVFGVGIVAHELIHALAWMAAARLPWSDIRFGFDRKSFTPFAHAKRPTRVKAYRIGVLMPGFLTGLLPLAVAFLIGDGALMTAGLLFTLVAGGDFLILWLIRGLDPDELVLDHPTRAGCMVVAGPLSRPA